MYLVTFHNCRIQQILSIATYKNRWTMCIIQYETASLTYLLPLGLILIGASPLRAICQFWWLVKSSHVSVLRLRSQEWLKRFLLKWSTTGRFFQTASHTASCPASNLSGKLQILFKHLWPQNSYRDLLWGENLHESFGLFMCQTNMLCRVFCFTLCNFEKENKLRVYINMPNM